MFEQLFDPSRYAFNVLAFQSQIVAFAAFCLGVFMLGRELDHRLRSAFFLLTSTISIWLFADSLMYASLDEATALAWAKVAYWGIAFIPAANYHFSAFILRDYEAVRSRVFAAWTVSAAFFALLFSTDLVFGTIYRYSWGWFPRYTATGIPFSLFFIGMVFAVLFRLRRGIGDAKKDPIAVNRLKGILIAYLVGGLACWDFLPLYGVDLYPLGYVPILLFTMIAAYLIAKHRFPELRPNVVLPRIIDTMQDALLVFDQEGVIRLVNNTTCALFARSEKELVGKTLPEGLPDTVQFATDFEFAIRTELQRDRELEFVRPDGSRITLTLSVSIIRERTGDARFFVCIMHDITRRIQTEQALRQSNVILDRQLRFTQTLLKTEPVAVFFKDTEGRYLGCNEEFSEIAGVSPEDIKGKTVFDLWPADLAQKYHEQDMALLRNPGHQVYEFKVKNAHGDMREVIFNKDVFTDENGAVQGIIGTFFDITERKRAEEQIVRLNEGLELRVAERTRELESVVERLRVEIAEHRRAEEALRESEIKYRTLFEESFDGIFITAPVGKILDINKKGIAMLGYSTKEEVRRLDLARDVYADAVDRSRILAIVNEHGSAEYEVMVKRRDGTKITAYCSLTEVKDHAGAITMYRGIIRDITAQKRTGDALQEAKRRLEHVLSTSPAVIYACRCSGQWQATFVSENLIEVLGYTASENTETPGFWIDRIHPEDRQRVIEGLQNIAASDFYAHEYRFQHKDGRYLWMLDRFRVIRDARGAPVECIGSWLDITERKKVEEDLRTNRIFLNNILNSIQDPLIVLDRNQNILVTNKTFETAFAAGSLRDIIGKSCHEILFGSVDPCGVCLAEQSNLTGKVSHKVISYPGGPEGSKWYDVFAYPLFTAEGRVVGNVHHLRDITDHRKAEEKIVKDQEQLRSLTHQLLTSEERERQRISRELHDEMGQMLTGIKLNLQEVRQQANADAAKKIGGIQQDIGDLMVRMRNLSARLRPSLLDDLGLLPALQWHIERFSKQARVRVEFSHEGLDRRLPHEASLTLFRVIQESLTNAVRHSGAESVKITLIAHDGATHVLVRDEGAGFDPEDALNRRTTLGLAGMRERVEMAGGSLMIKSAPGEGTEIRCSIPVDGALPHSD